MMANTDIKQTFYELVDNPDERFKKFFDFYCDVKINESFSIDKYLRSGKEMLRMADVYLHEHDYLHSFILYTRYSLLYVSKIKSHPEYDQVDKVELSNIQKQIRKSVLQKAEKLKAYIKELFQNEAKEYAELLKQKKESLEKKTQPSAPDLTMFDDTAKVNNEIKSIDKSSFTASNKYGLRNVVVPSNLSQEFLRFAENNTKRNIETCGILAGKLQQSVFVISHCIIPKQSGCCDTCTTEKEGEIFDIIDKLDLITLGWIHTHPSQTAFLSSIDMHSQYAYQIMIPEAIAIVCAPKYNDVSTFFLTPNFGIKAIGDCRESGFHMHSTNPPLFEKCDHVNVDNITKINMIDIRNT